MQRLRAALKDAERFVAAMPSDKVGVLFLVDGRPVQPDSARLETYATHALQSREHWPSSPGITAAMLERLRELEL